MAGFSSDCPQGLTIEKTGASRDSRELAVKLIQDLGLEFYSPSYRSMVEGIAKALEDSWRQGHDDALMGVRLLAIAREARNANNQR